MINQKKLQSEYPDLDKYINENKDICYYKKDTGIKHNPYGPAYITKYGFIAYYIDGKFHRADGPAVIHLHNSEEWWLNDKKHRIGGPAVTFHNGTKEWWVNNKRHRLDGPAIIKYDGTKEYYVDNIRHRLDGPAFISRYGKKEWWVNNKLISHNQNDFYLRLKNFPNKNDQPQNKIDILNIKNAIQNNIDNTSLSLLKLL